MAEEKLDGRELSWRHLFPWTELFRGFQVALDLNKLLLAAAGILVMSVGWWLLSYIFAAPLEGKPPAWPAGYLREAEDDQNKAWARFKSDRDHWNLMYETANLRGDHNHRYEIEDLAGTLEEYNLVKEELKGSSPREVPDRIDRLVRENKLSEQKGRLYTGRLGKYKPAARLATWPWVENRGPNPYLLVTGQAGIPWETGHFWDWFLRDQLLVMIEPLVKLVLPVIYFFNARAGFVSSLYFLLVLLWTLATWAIFGGAITRIAAVQVARGEKLGLSEALRFTLKRILSYLMAPLCPLIGVFLILVVMVLFGLVQMIPIFGDIFIDGLFWPLMILLGLAMAVLLVGLVGWPLMSCTISAEGTDSWEAVTRAYSYVYQKPWHYLWYSLVAIAYGAVLVFFVGLMGSLMVYLAKWGIQQTPLVKTVNREPSFLFAYAPSSFGWRTLLLEGATVHGENIVENGQVNPGLYNDYDYMGTSDYRGKDRMSGWNWVGALMVAFWLGLVFLLVLGFGYSYFWSASTIIYLLMRRNLDAAELDEVYLEEDEHDSAFGGGIPPAPLAPAASKPSIATPTMVEPPTYKAPSSASPITSPPPALPREKPPEKPPETALEKPPAPPLTLPPNTEKPLPEPPPPAAEKPAIRREPSTPPPLLEPPRPPEGETPPRGPDAPL